MRGRAGACAHGGTTPMHLEDCPHKMNAVCPPVFRTQHPDLRRRRIDLCCHSSYATMLPEISAKNFPEIRGGHTFIVCDEKKKVSIHIAVIVPIGCGRRYTLSIYSTTTTTPCR